MEQDQSIWEEFSVFSFQGPEGRAYFVVPFFLALAVFLGVAAGWLDVIFFAAELAFTLFLVFAAVCPVVSWVVSWAVSWAVRWGPVFFVVDFFSEKIRSQLEENWTVDPV